MKVFVRLVVAVTLGTAVVGAFAAVRRRRERRRAVSRPLGPAPLPVRFVEEDESGWDFAEDWD
ncbi:hypothetical protein [Saccharopolyspora sp. CA-218241]|uniref:hypothetical protein n=1 Tax=Saccharopolyspora sp. CA-218241 TaxID=3240027 RepID=UPI003D965D78